MIAGKYYLTSRQALLRAYARALVLSMKVPAAASNCSWSRQLKETVRRTFGMLSSDQVTATD